MSYAATCVLESNEGSDKTIASVECSTCAILHASGMLRSRFQDALDAGTNENPFCNLGDYKHCELRAFATLCEMSGGVPVTDGETYEKFMSKERNDSLLEDGLELIEMYECFGLKMLSRMSILNFPTMRSIIAYDKHVQSTRDNYTPWPPEILSFIVRETLTSELSAPSNKFVPITEVDQLKQLNVLSLCDVIRHMHETEFNPDNAAKQQRAMARK